MVREKESSWRGEKSLEWLDAARVKRRPETTKVSLILISISWCDVYLTTTAWLLQGKPKESRVVGGYISRELKFHVRDVLFRDTAGPGHSLASAHSQPTTGWATFPAAQMLLYSQHRVCSSSSRYRNLHIIRTDSASKSRDKYLAFLKGVWLFLKF